MSSTPGFIYPPTPWLASGIMIILSALLPLPSVSGAEYSPSLAELRELSIEDLLNVEVTSVTLKEALQFDSPAAISVLSNDDIQRSGATSLADALRQVPGLNVASVNSSQHAISARGFGGVFSNKMLVLMDGRAVYSPLFGGVYWDLQQAPLEDIARVEVIRGPGGAIWGANAMNGVINVVSQSAEKTQGTYAYAGGGNVHQAMVGARHGGTIGDNLYYRVFGSYQGTDDYRLATGASAQDAWQSWHGGFRFDYVPSPDVVATWQGDSTILNLHDGASSAYNANTLARWKKRLSARSNIEIQSYYDRTARDEVSLPASEIDTFDLKMQHGFGLGEAHDILWGLGYRLTMTSVRQANSGFTVKDKYFNLNLFSLFLQDEWHMVPDRFTLITGTKLEHNDYTGFELQPSLRALFKPTEKQTLWAAVSRAVRTPSVVEGRDVFAVPYGTPFPGPGGLYVPAIVGNGDPQAEVLWAYELGYRAQPHENLSVDLAAFYNHYTGILGIDGITRLIPGVPVGTAEIPFSNYLSAETYGGEVTLTAVPTKRWRLTTSYSLLLANFHGPAGSTPETMEKNMPTHQAYIRSSHDVTDRFSVDLQLRYSDQLDLVPAYVTADIRFFYRVTDRLDLSVVLQNLLSDHHLEQSQQTGTGTGTAEVPRGIYGKLTWRF